MPWVTIPVERVSDLTLFGYEKLGVEDGFEVFEHRKTGRKFILKQIDPRVWLDDWDDAYQLGAKELYQLSDIS